MTASGRCRRPVAPPPERCPAARTGCLGVGAGGEGVRTVPPRPLGPRQRLLLTGAQGSEARLGRSERPPACPRSVDTCQHGRQWSSEPRRRWRASLPTPQSHPQRHEGAQSRAGVPHPAPQTIEPSLLAGNAAGAVWGCAGLGEQQRCQPIVSTFWGLKISRFCSVFGRREDLKDRRLLLLSRCTKPRQTTPPPPPTPHPHTHTPAKASWARTLPEPCLSPFRQQQAQAPGVT